MRRRTATTLLFAALAAALLGAACGGGQTKADRLKEAIFYFNEGVRWGRVQDVVARLDPKSVDGYVASHVQFGNEIQISSYDIVTTIMSPDGNKADVGVQITWYRIDEMVVHTTVLVQHWEHLEREWRMVAEEFRSGTPIY